MKINDTFITVSSRIRLARNFDGYLFPEILRKNGRGDEVVSFVSKLLLRCDYKILKMDRVSEIEKKSLFERYYISKLLSRFDSSAVAISPDKNLSVLINEEDHIREQCITVGLDLFGAYSKILQLDKMLSNNFRFAKSGNDFLTACPSNYGSGMRASVMMFLPALSYSHRIEYFVLDAQKNGITIRGAFGEGSTAEGYWYQVSNSRTMAKCEDIIKSVEEYVLSLADSENDERYALYETFKYKFEDRCLRALGILKHCRLLSFEECVELISEVKLGNAMGFIPLKNPTALDDLSVMVRPNTLELLRGNGNEETIRADFVKDALKKIE